MAAFEWFRRRGVDVAVVEVGLGGRLDATNVWDGGVAAITTIGLDHMEYLGPTVRDIAREKAAIIKAGDLAISGAHWRRRAGHPPPGAPSRRSPGRGRAIRCAWHGP